MSLVEEIVSSVDSNKSDDLFVEAPDVRRNHHRGPLTSTLGQSTPVAHPTSCYRYAYSNPDCHVVDPIYREDPQHTTERYYSS